MGLLDDAIREHLELKRRHGADPGEVAAQEREAFGPGQMPTIPEVERPSEPEASAPPAAPEAEVEEPSVDTDLPDASEALPPSTEEHRGAVSIDRFGGDDIDWSEPPPLRDDPEPEAEAPKDEDVLEETPEFLQETPEHDRLWFEQRPPKDFDF